jgi:hypothetical protein
LSSPTGDTALSKYFFSSDCPAGFADVAGQQGQVHQGVDVIVPVGMLGETHTPDKYGFFVVNQLGDFFQFLTGDAGAPAGTINIEICYLFAHSIKSDGLLFTELLIMPILIGSAYFLKIANSFTWPLWRTAPLSRTPD